jgi:IS30 family transposase
MGRSGQGAQLPMVKFREIIRLHELGYNQSEIAQSCCRSPFTVQDYIRRASGKGLSYASCANSVIVKPKPDWAKVKRPGDSERH